MKITITDHKWEQYRRHLGQQISEIDRNVDLTSKEDILKELSRLTSEDMSKKYSKEERDSVFEAWETRIEDLQGALVAINAKEEKRNLDLQTYKTRIEELTDAETIANLLAKSENYAALSEATDIPEIKGFIEELFEYITRLQNETERSGVLEIDKYFHDSEFKKVEEIENLISNQLITRKRALDAHLAVLEVKNAEAERRQNELNKLQDKVNTYTTDSDVVTTSDIKLDKETPVPVGIAEKLVEASREIQAKLEVKEQTFPAEYNDDPEFEAEISKFNDKKEELKVNLNKIKDTLNEVNRRINLANINGSLNALYDVYVQQFNEIKPKITYSTFEQAKELLFTLANVISTNTNEKTDQATTLVKELEEDKTVEDREYELVSSKLSNLVLEITKAIGNPVEKRPNTVAWFEDEYTKAKNALTEKLEAELAKVERVKDVFDAPSAQVFPEPELGVAGNLNTLDELKNRLTNETESAGLIENIIIDPTEWNVRPELTTMVREYTGKKVELDNIISERHKLIDTTKTELTTYREKLRAEVEKYLLDADDNYTTDGILDNTKALTSLLNEFKAKRELPLPEVDAKWRSVLDLNQLVIPSSERFVRINNIVAELETALLVSKYNDLSNSVADEWESIKVFNTFTLFEKHTYAGKVRVDKIIDAFENYKDKVVATAEVATVNDGEFASLDTLRISNPIVKEAITRLNNLLTEDEGITSKLNDLKITKEYIDRYFEEKDVNLSMYRESFERLVSTLTTPSALISELPLKDLKVYNKNKNLGELTSIKERFKAALSTIRALGETVTGERERGVDTTLISKSKRYSKYTVGETSITDAFNKIKTKYILLENVLETALDDIDRQIIAVENANTSEEELYDALIKNNQSFFEDLFNNLLDLNVPTVQSIHDKGSIEEKIQEARRLETELIDLRNSAEEDRSKNQNEYHKLINNAYLTATPHNKENTAVVISNYTYRYKKVNEIAENKITQIKTTLAEVKKIKAELLKEYGNKEDLLALYDYYMRDTQVEDITEPDLRRLSDTLGIVNLINIINKEIETIASYTRIADSYLDDPRFVEKKANLEDKMQRLQNSVDLLNARLAEIRKQEESVGDANGDGIIDGNTSVPAEMRPRLVDVLEKAFTKWASMDVEQPDLTELTNNDTDGKSLEELEALKEAQMAIKSVIDGRIHTNDNEGNRIKDIVNRDHAGYNMDEYSSAKWFGNFEGTREFEVRVPIAAKLNELKAKNDRNISLIETAIKSKNEENLKELVAEKKAKLLSTEAFNEADLNDAKELPSSTMKLVDQLTAIGSGDEGKIKAVADIKKKFDAVVAEYNAITFPAVLPSTLVDTKADYESGKTHITEVNRKIEEAKTALTERKESIEEELNNLNETMEEIAKAITEFREVLDTSKTFFNNENGTINTLFSEINNEGTVI